MKAACVATFGLGILFGGTSWAQIHKCVGPDGRPTYSDQPCGPDQKGEVMKTPKGRVGPSTAPASTGAEKTAAENARRAEQVALAECAAKKKVLDERRPHFATLSEQLRVAFTKLDAEYKAQCEPVSVRR